LHYPLSNILHDDKIHDIWNGERLSSQFNQAGFFSTPEHLAFSIFTDGIPIFKSSSTSLWPVYLTINNLPPNIRMNAENVIVSSLWYGPSKPPMHHLLNPIANFFQKLATLGVSLLTPEGVKIVRGKIVLGIFDLAALNMKQYGEYGCSVCLNPGVHQNGARVYLPLNFPNRTNSSVRKSADEATKKGSPVLGIKGLSILSHLFDLVDGVTVDYMHAVLEGVTRWLLHRWFDSKHHAEPYYLG